MRQLLLLLFIAGCAHGIVQDVEATDAPQAIAVPTVDASSADAVAVDEIDAARSHRARDAAPDAPLTCEATTNDDACFDCCDAKYPKADDLWLDALDACCPNDECTDEEYDACETKADEACAKNPECIGRDTCEETSGCWEKVSSGP